MTIVALALVAAFALSVLGLAGVLRSLVRAHARERDLLIDKLMHLAGKTWREPPATAQGLEQAAEDFEDRYVMSPSQLPDDYDT